MCRAIQELARFRGSEGVCAILAEAKVQTIWLAMKFGCATWTLATTLAICRRVMMLVKAGAPVESTIDLLVPLLEEGDQIIDGGNEWYENTEHRQKKVAEKGLMYLGMGVSGGEEGARNGVY